MPAPPTWPPPPQDADTWPTLLTAPVPSTMPIQPAPPRPPVKRSGAGRVIGMIVVVFALLGVASYAVYRNSLDNDATPTFPVASAPTEEPTGELDLGPSGETFNMTLGQGVQVVGGEDTLHLYITKAEWFDVPCEEFGVAEYPILVLDVDFEVIAGTASLNPPVDFSYVTEDGVRADQSLLSFCDEPVLVDTLDKTEGDVRTGKIAFEVPGGMGGRLEYSDESVLHASWLIPGQS
jgi:hypothetical protein